MIFSLNSSFQDKKKGGLKQFALKTVFRSEHMHKNTPPYAHKLTCAYGVYYFTLNKTPLYIIALLCLQMSCITRMYKRQKNLCC